MFKRLEDITIWKRARVVCRDIYGLTRRDPFCRDYGLRDQIQRASVSVMANVAEGAGRGGNREFAQFLRIAKGSAAAVRSHLYVAYDVGYIDSETRGRLCDEVHEIECMIGGLLNRLRRAQHERTA